MENLLCTIGICGLLQLLFCYFSGLYTSVIKRLNAMQSKPTPAGLHLPLANERLPIMGMITVTAPPFLLPVIAAVIVAVVAVAQAIVAGVAVTNFGFLEIAILLVSLVLIWPLLKGAVLGVYWRILAYFGPRMVKITYENDQGERVSEVIDFNDTDALVEVLLKAKKPRYK